MNTTANAHSQKKKTNKLMLAVIGIMVAVFFFQSGPEFTGTVTAAPAPAKAEETPQQAAHRARLQAARDDAYRVKRMIKERQRDPASFEVVSVTWHPTANALCFAYRSKNGFGGTNVSRAIYGRDSGKLVYSETLKGFTSMWEAGCGQGDGIPFNV